MKNAVRRLYGLRCLFRPRKKLTLSEITLARPAYAGRHVGRRFLVLGTGPSLATHGDAIRELIKVRSLITLGANHITPFIYPDYHAFTGRRRFKQYVHTADPARSTVLLSPYLPPELVRAHYRRPYEELMYINDHDAPFGISDGIVQASCRSAGNLLIAVALVMGASEVLVAGMDGYQNAEFYFTPTQVKHPGDKAYWERKETAIRRAQREIAAYMEAIGLEPFKIVTPTAYSQYYRPIEEFL
jgi:hypothetical protein